MTLSDIEVAAPTTSAAELYSKLLRGDNLFILDVRNPDDFARWRVEGRAGLEVKNLPYYDFIEDEDAASAEIPTDREILVVCAKEGSSQYVSGLLRDRGLNASYLTGGILSWGYLYDVRTAAKGAWGEIIQIARPARGDVSFMVVSNGEAAVIDPLRHIDHYEQVISERNATLSLILDTHVHADHISGGPALSTKTGAGYYVHAYDAIHPIDMLPAKIAYRSMEDGQTFQLGSVTIKAIWFPGHTLGQMNFLVQTPDGAGYLFTGDGIFIKSFGRPDLGGRGEAWTPILYESLYQRLPSQINAATQIMPSHFSMLDESNPDGVFMASYGDLLHSNDALHLRSLEEFTSFVLGNLPTFPAQYVEIKRVNIGLSNPNESEAEELELGKNICALSDH